MVSDDDGTKAVKKPVPLPRKSLLKQNKMSGCKESKNKGEENAESKKSESKYFVRDDWRSASESFVFEKSKLMKNEIHKLEKTVRNKISRRKSSIPKSCEVKTFVSEQCRSESFLDDNIFLKISFNSPLSENEKVMINNEQSITYSENISYSQSESLPPPYPPPDLPDESLYDQTKSLSTSDQNSYKSNSSETSSIYDDLFVCKSLTALSLDSNKNDSIKESLFESEPLYSDDAKRNDMYELIEENSTTNSSENIYGCLLTGKKISNTNDNNEKDKNLECNSENSHIRYIIHLFDPLKEKNEGSLNKEERKLSPKSEILFNQDFKTSEVSEKFTAEDNGDDSSKTYSCYQQNLEKGHYGKINKIKTSDKLIESRPEKEKLNISPPPIPPRRIDSLKVDSKEIKPEKLQEFQISQNECSVDSEEKEKFKISINELQAKISIEEKSKVNDVMQWSSIKRVARKVANNFENRTSYLSITNKKGTKICNDEALVSTSNKKKLLNPDENYLLFQNFPKHSGVIYRPGGIQRWGVLSQRKLTLFANKDSPDVKETIPMDGVLSVQVTQNKISAEAVAVHCFEISISCRNQPLIFGVSSVSERHIWMRKFLESIGDAFPTKLSMDYTKAGWCFAKESIACVWTKCSILLHHRTLYLSSENGSLITADLRKARNISLQADGFPCETVTEKGPLMLIDLQDKTLYLQMDYERETKAWEIAITTAALKNGPTLSEQQLTKDNVSAIVDKCLNFIHTHGSFSEGIYRRNGSNRGVNQLLAALRCNAWSVQLIKEEYTEFDVSSVLKRYFRDLPEPLIIPEILEDLEKTLYITDEKEKIEQYKIALKKLSIINYLTAKRLLCHLYFIDKLKDKNLMSAENLAAIWGPTLLQVQKQVSLNSTCFKMETLVVTDLITYYPEIFNVDEKEVEKEMKILEMLESYHNNSNTLNKKPSGELKIWIYLHSDKSSDSCVNVSISPQKTSEEVCKELGNKTNYSLHDLCLEEIICNGRLSRPLIHSEKVLDTVLRWSYWDEKDRKENYLVLSKNDLFQQAVQYSKSPIIFCEELKFADQKTKAFKLCQFEFTQAKLLCYKDKVCSQKIGEWNVEDIVWYIGHEAKRVPQTKWSITFIEKGCLGPRTKEKPYFGNTIGGNSEEQKLKLITVMLLAKYAKEILPTPNLME